MKRLKNQAQRRTKDVRWSALLVAGKWPAMMEIANHNVRVVVKLEAMHKVSTGKGGRHQACFSQQVSKRLTIGVDGRLAQVAAIVLEDEM